jgi:hypothetical protein
MSVPEHGGGRRFSHGLPARVIRTATVRQWQRRGFLDAEVDRTLPQRDEATPGQRAFGRGNFRGNSAIDEFRKQVLARLSADCSIDLRPPIPKIPTLIGWDFFCPFPQCWRGFRAWPCERHPCEVGVFAPTDASLFSVFSGGHASVLEAISFAGAGLEAVGCGWQLL